MQERIAAKDVLHDLKKFVLRQERAFPFDEFEGKKYPYFVKDGKKFYFKHPTRPEFNLSDDTLIGMYQTHEVVNFKSAIFKLKEATKDLKEIKEIGEADKPPKKDK